MTYIPLPYAQGLDAARKGWTSEACPYRPGSPKAGLWARGYGRGK